jgi:hypothetical protein
MKTQARSHVSKSFIMWFEQRYIATPASNVSSRIVIIVSHLIWLKYLPRCASLYLSKMLGAGFWGEGDFETLDDGLRIIRAAAFRPTRIGSRRQLCCCKRTSKSSQHIWCRSLSLVV